MTNYPYFSALLKNLVEDRLITELRLCLSEQLSLALLPGSFRALETRLRKATDLSTLVDDIVSDGLGSQLAFVKTRMNIEVFASRLNKAAVTALSKELKRLGFEESRVREVLSDYRRERDTRKRGPQEHRRDCRGLSCRFHRQRVLRCQRYVSRGTA